LVFLSTMNCDARSTTHQINLMFVGISFLFGVQRVVVSLSPRYTAKYRNIMNLWWRYNPEPKVNVMI